MTVLDGLEAELRAAHRRRYGSGRLRRAARPAVAMAAVVALIAGVVIGAPGGRDAETPAGEPPDTSVAAVGEALGGLRAEPVPKAVRKQLRRRSARREFGLDLQRAFAVAPPHGPEGEPAGRRGASGLWVVPGARGLCASFDGAIECDDGTRFYAGRLAVLARTRDYTTDPLSYEGVVPAGFARAVAVTHDGQTVARADVSGHAYRITVPAPDAAHADIRVERTDGGAVTAFDWPTRTEVARLLPPGVPLGPAERERLLGVVGVARRLPGHGGRWRVWATERYACVGTGAGSGCTPLFRFADSGVGTATLAAGRFVRRGVVPPDVVAVRAGEREVAVDRQTYTLSTRTDEAGTLELVR